MTFEAAQESAQRVVAELRLEENGSSEAAADQTSKKETGPEPVEGEICEVTELYKSQKSTCSCCTEWTEEKPFKEKRVEKKAETKHATFAINRRLEPHGSGLVGGGWKTNSLVIYSQRIRSSLEKVFEGYPISYASNRELVLRPPFTPFLHRWDDLIRVEQCESDPENKKHLKLLCETLRSELTESFQRLNDVKETGFAEFQDLALVLAPGDILVHNIDIGMQAGRLLEVDLIKREDEIYLNLRVDVVDWDGTKFGFRTISWKFHFYGGNRRISSLGIFPLHLHPDQQAIRNSLVKRGRKLESLCGIHFKTYSGPIEAVGYGSAQWFSADKLLRERVIIDTEGYYTLEKGYAPDMQPLEKPALNKTSLAPEDAFAFVSACPSELGEGPAVARDPNGLTDDQCLVTCCFARGFALQTRQWCKFPVDNIQDIHFVPGLMQKLVLDKDEKDLIIAFLNNDSRALAFDDFIPGKGERHLMG
ncbi:hypothetical protein RRF57_004746 [Xylaria bambusicola]|uniref:DUF7025 domain-containing protein n=1 Tax=Xylaria bambusicola TaxID=326684 RepID=A0AAN7Z8V6_9PEZI